MQLEAHEQTSTRVGLATQDQLGRIIAGGQGVGHGVVDFHGYEGPLARSKGSRGGGSGEPAGGGVHAPNLEAGARIEQAIGAGALGMEMADVFMQMGLSVHLFEKGLRILPDFDESTLESFTINRAFRVQPLQVINFSRINT